VVINVQLNASIKHPENEIFVDKELLAQHPILIVGGFSHETSYLQSVFFERECQVMQHLRTTLPNQTILYSPHPKIGKENAQLNSILAHHAIGMSPLSTLELIMHAKAAIGTFSSSLFEAALLDCPVLLLPFDDGLLIPTLLELPLVTRAKTDAEIATALDALCQMEFASPAADFAEYADLCQRRLGVKLIQEPF
jgi:CDP-glycerol glycerophosphotransferase (TagB/SpsB family)